MDSFDKHPSDYVMAYNRDIPYAVNFLNNTHLNYNLFDEIPTTFYNEKVMSLNIYLGYL